MFLGHNDSDTPRTPEAEPNEQKQTTRTKSEQRSVKRSVPKEWKTLKMIPKVKEQGIGWNQEGTKSDPKG